MQGYYLARQLHCILLGEKPLLASSRLSAWNNWAPHWTYFHEICFFFKYFRKSVEKIQVSLKSDKNNGYFIWRRSTFMIISRWILLRIVNVSEEFVDKIKTHISCSIHFFFPRQWCSLWDNAIQYGTAREAADYNKIRRVPVIQNLTFVYIWTLQMLYRFHLQAVLNFSEMFKIFRHTVPASQKLAPLQKFDRVTSWSGEGEAQVSESMNPNVTRARNRHDNDTI